MGNPIRHFFALVPSEKGIEFLRQRMDLFRGRGWEKFGRFVSPDDLHLTLRFLGEIPEETSVALQAAATELARHTPPFTYGIGRSVLFPRVSRARVIAATIAPSEELQKLVRSLEKLCVQSGLPAEERLFRPHMTLARLRNQMKRPNLPSRPGAITEHVSFFSLLRTNQRGTPEAYEELACFSLEGAPG
jgi:2'-5' RNA ligase